MMLTVEALRIRIKSFTLRNSRSASNPATIEGVYSVVNKSKWNEKQ
jgi:hypothetical protein